VYFKPLITLQTQIHFQLRGLNLKPETVKVSKATSVKFNAHLCEVPSVTIIRVITNCNNLMFWLQLYSLSYMLASSVLIFYDVLVIVPFSKEPCPKT